MQIRLCEGVCVSQQSVFSILEVESLDGLTGCRTLAEVGPTCMRKRALLD